MTKLTLRQAEQLMELVGQRLVWFRKVRQRMERIGIDPTGHLFRAACEAENAAGGLFMACHYASCTSGVPEDFQLPKQLSPPGRA